MKEFEEILKNIQNTESDFNEFEIWIENGIERGWITEPFCNTHEGDPYMSEEEQERVGSRRRPMPTSNQDKGYVNMKKLVALVAVLFSVVVPVQAQAVGIKGACNY
jgi:hypothetical protein